MSYDRFRAIFDESPYSDDQLRSLYEALLADPDADIEKLTCKLCGIAPWRDDSPSTDQNIVDMATEAAADDSTFTGDLEDADAVVRWCIGWHACEDHSPFARPAGMREEEEWRERIEAIEAVTDRE